jgi:hypothetical protein
MLDDSFDLVINVSSLDEMPPSVGIDTSKGLIGCVADTFIWLAMAAISVTASG